MKKHIIRAVISMLVIIAAVLGADLYVIHAGDGDRFGIFYTQKVDDIYTIRVLHDAVTGQEIVCIRNQVSVSDEPRTLSCYPTGRTWK